MIKNSLPLEAIPEMTPEEKQNHMLRLFTSIDLTLKRLLVWAEPASFGNGIELQYEKVFGKEEDVDLLDFCSSAVSSVVEGSSTPAKAAPKRKAAAKKVETTPEAPAAAEETTLSPAPVATQAPAPAAAPVATQAPAPVATQAPAPAAAPVVDSLVTIDNVRSTAEKFIIELTTKGQNGREVFSNLLKTQGVQILTALDKSKYSTLIAEMVKLAPSIAAVAAPEAFDPLA